MKIQEWLQLNKQKILMVILVFLIASLAFGAGYLFRGEVKKSPILIEKYSK